LEDSPLASNGSSEQPAKGDLGPGFPDVSDLAGGLRGAASIEEFSVLLADTVCALGFAYHALVHHADLACPPPRFIFLQNYPASWVETYARAGLHRIDPARRLAGQRPGSFAWEELPRLGGLSDQERAMMEDAHRAGLGQGFTVPLHAPGERAASCSFAMAAGQDLPKRSVLAAELLAHVAFAALFDLRHPGRLQAPRLTARQRECVTLMAQGKTDWEIAAILGLGEETVTAYLKEARRRFGVSRRTQLALAALSYGLVGFDEIITWQSPL
jgi:LuxR family quorum-sensing system transcriptional regulator CciR